MIVEGSLSVKAVLEGGKHTLERLYLQDSKRSKDINYIRHLAHRENVPIDILSREELEKIGSGKTHGGILLECGPRTYEQLDELPIGSKKLILCVEGIEDPFNLGMIIRTAYIMGVDAIMTPDRPFHHTEPILIKASAGTSERILWYRGADLGESIGSLKKQGYKVFAATRSVESIELPQADFTDSCIICIGGEMRGLSKEVLEQSDQEVMIEYPFKARVALSAVSATSMFLYEVNRQRKT